MSITTIHEAPNLESFLKLADYQSHTPTSYHDVKPVLHFHATKMELVITQHLDPAPAIFKLDANSSPEDPSWISECVDVFVTSEYVSPLPPFRPGIC